MTKVYRSRGEGLDDAPDLLGPGVGGVSHVTHHLVFKGGVTRESNILITIISCYHYH